MGALPKRKISRCRQGKRRGAIYLKKPTLVTCPNCSQKKLPHQVCPNCGYYKGKEVIKLKTKKKSKEKSRA